MPLLGCPKESIATHVAPTKSIAKLGCGMRFFAGLPLTARACLVFLSLLALACWLGPLSGLPDPHRPDWTALSQAPSSAHWFGTDAIGRDVLARTLAGGRLSLTV